VKRDKFGRIVTMNWKCQLDGGDTCANESAWHWASSVLNPQTYDHRETVAFVEAIEKEPGVFVRHPASTEEFWNDPKRFSRDQNEALIIFLGQCGHDDALDRHFKAILKRGLRFQNKDISALGLDFGALFGRQWLKRKNNRFAPIIKALLPVFDLYLVGKALAKTKWAPRWNHDEMKFTDGNRDIDDRNLIMLLCDAKLTHETRLSKLAAKIYFKHRAKHEWSKPCLAHWQTAILHYYSEETGNNEEIGIALFNCARVLFET